MPALPIHTAFASDFLARPVRDFLKETTRPSSCRTRALNLLEGHGVEWTWQMMCLREEDLFRWSGAGDGVVALVRGALGRFGAPLDAFPELRSALIDLRRSTTPFGLGWIAYLAALGNPTADERVHAALGRIGLRPGMPLSELFDCESPFPPFRQLRALPVRELFAAPDVLRELAALRVVTVEDAWIFLAASDHPSVPGVRRAFLEACVSMGLRIP